MPGGGQDMDGRHDGSDMRMATGRAREERPTIRPAIRRPVRGPRTGRRTVTTGRTVVALVLAMAVVAVSSACEIRVLDSGGYHVIPDTASGARLLILGDSLIRQPSLSVAVSNINGGVETLIEATNTAGLVSGPVRDAERAVALIDAFHPTAVLLGYSGNFTEPFWPGYHPPGAPGSPEWNAWIEQQTTSVDFVDRNTEAAIALTKVFQDAGVAVYWVESPPFPPTYAVPTVPDRLWARWQTALPAARPGVHLLSVRPSITTPTGAWTRHKTICNQGYEIRSVDWDGGVHFTADGAGTYGRALARAIAAAEGWPAPAQHCVGWPD